MAYVFVYGTLKKKHGNHGVLNRAPFIGDGITNSREFTMFDGGFPYVSDQFSDSKDNGSVVGELYEVTSDITMSNLDRLEGVPHMYVRKDVTVTTLDGEEYQALMYVASEATNSRLKERDSMKPKGRRKLLEWR